MSPYRYENTHFSMPRWIIPPRTRRWFLLLALSLGMTLWYFLAVPSEHEVPAHEKQALMALAFSLLTSAIFSLLAAFTHSAQPIRSGLWMLGIAGLCAGLVFFGYGASFGLFGL